MLKRLLIYVNRYVKLIIGICISVVGLYYAFIGIDFTQLWIIIKQVDLFYGFLALFIIIFSNVVRTIRWQILAKPIDEISFKPGFSAIMIGYFGNSVLPFRMGEFLRAYILAEKTSLNAPTAFGTIVIERILDFVGLSLLILLAIIAYPAEWIDQKIIIGVVALSIGAFAFLFYFNEIKKLFPFQMDKMKYLNKNPALKIITFFSKIISGAIAIRSTNNHAAVVYVLTSFLAINQLDAQASAILIHAVGTIPFIIIGAWYFINSSVSIKDINQKKIINN